MVRHIIVSWHRFYDPDTGRYVSADPIGLRGGGDLFAYVHGDPVNWIDPWGLRTEIIVWKPVGSGSSAAGHVSSNVNGNNHSWGPGGWDTKYPNADDYAERQESFRSGEGFILDLTPEQERQLEECYSRKRAAYDKFDNNCGDPHKECLEEVLGEPISDSLLPLGIRNDLQESPHTTGTKNYYGPTLTNDIIAP